MKVLLICAAVLGAAMCAVPAPSQGWRPSGRLVLLPARVENPPPAEYTPTSTNSTQEPASDEKEPARILDQGAYYVLLEDGRLQMVKYTTSPLKQEADKSSSDSSPSQQTQQQVRQPEPFAQFQVEYFQFPQAQPQAQEPQTAQTKVEDKANAEGYEANVQYRDVKPISAPIYAYNPTPLVRILKK